MAAVSGRSVPTTAEPVVVVAIVSGPPVARVGMRSSMIIISRSRSCRSHRFFMEGRVVGIAFKEKVERWLREIGYSVSDLTDSSVAWRLAIDHPPQTQNKMLLIGPKGGDDAVVIATGAQIAPQHLA